MFTASKIKADLVFVLSLIVVFGFNIPTAISVAIVAAAGLIAAALNLGDALLNKYDPKLVTDLTAELAKLEKDAVGVLPLLLPVLEALPGKIGQEIATAIQDIEHGPTPAVPMPAKPAKA
jgi:hypothetical protein